MLLIEEFPELAIEFDELKNATILLSKLYSQSNKNVYWKCNKGHEWKAVVQSRIKGNISRPCPYCLGVKPSADYNFAIRNPKLLEIWDFEKNDKHPEEYSPKSNKSVFWKCKFGHNWENSIKRTVLQNGKCPICKEKKVVSSFYNLELNYPNLMEFWDFDKNIKPPNSYTPFSSKKVYWKCINGHSYLQPIVHKTRLQYGCPKCKIKGSRNEVRLFCELKSFGLDVELRYKIKKTEFDIYLPAYNLAIEYDGWYFHKNRKIADLKKNKLSLDFNIKLIRIREQPLEKLSSLDIIIPQGWLNKLQLNIIFQVILKGIISEFELLKYNQLDSFINEALFNEELKYIILPKNEYSIVSTHPELALEWDYIKNHPLTPEQFSQGSEKKVWWTCLNGHSWKAAIDKRTGSKRDKPQLCLYCNNSIAHPEYNLLTEIKGVEKLWDFSKNQKTPNNYLPTSCKVVHWKCSIGHEFKASIVSRINRKTKKIRDCIFCNGSVASKENNLLLFCPEVIDYWDYDRNNGLKPEEFLPSSNKIVWWKCKTGHSFQLRIDFKINLKNGEVRTCRVCAETMWSKDNNLEVVFPFLVKEWDYDQNTLDPFYMTPYSNKQVYWKCRFGHSFRRAPFQRINRVSKKMVQCPICRGLQK